MRFSRDYILYRRANTIQRIRDRFQWPGMDAEVKWFCQACPTCQVTSPKKPPPSPLIPLPIIEVPFEHIGMDLVGPLPKSARRHEHILVIIDYATRYPEAIPLRKATAKAIAQELFLLSSRVGIPAEILTDQGTPFMSRLMADLCRLLKVKQLRTTVYHPQADGLVGRFNQTLKQMLRWVAAEDKRDWDLMIPYVLFGIREVPQASTGFTPFELLFGRQPRGLLDVAKGAWEQQPAAQRSVIEHVREMRERIDRVMPLVREHLSTAQQAQQRHYNRAAQPREFQPGDRVMVLVPTAACKFLATWQGPYTVLEKVGPVTYRIRQPGRRRLEQLYHVNLLKKWVGTRDQIVALACTEPVVVDTNPHLSAAQKGELQHLIGQLSDVFSPLPGLQTDASDTGLGAVMSQIQEGEEHPVLYISRKLTPAERDYATVEKEALAVKWAVLELRYYLLGRKFTLVTDHAPHPVDGPRQRHQCQGDSLVPHAPGLPLRRASLHRGRERQRRRSLSRIWAAFAGLSGVTPHPPPINPLLSHVSNRTRTTLRGGGV